MQRATVQVKSYFTGCPRIRLHRSLNSVPLSQNTQKREWPRTVLTVLPSDEAECLAALQGRAITILCSVSRCVLGEDGVARSFRVAGGASFERCLGTRFTVFVEVSESPAARRGVFF
jgi:hypothetical protein